MKIRKTLKLCLGLTSLLTFTVFGAVACAPVTVLNRITPSSSFDKATDVSYGPLARQSLDIYRAENPRAKAPVLIFIHGGSWKDGSKDIYKFLAEGFTSEGFDVVVPNYRLHPDAVYPQMIDDTALSIAFTAQQFEGRPLVIMGHSAGGYNVLMVGLNKTYLDNAGGDLCQSVAGVVSLSGPTGITPLTEEPYITIFPDRFSKDDAPVNNATAKSPPVFFGHGADDTRVYPQNSQRLAEKIEARDGLATVKIYDGMGHIGAVRVLSRHFDGESSLKDDMIKFATTLPSKGETGYCR